MVSGTARPGSRRGPPPGVTVFANARINKTTSYPCTAPRVQKHAPPRSCGNMHIPPNVSTNGQTLPMNLELEVKIIERFIKKAKKDRYLTFIKSGKSRIKFIKELAHFHDLRDDLFEEVIGDVYKTIISRVNNLNRITDCYLISESSALDQKRFDINTALRETIGSGMGTLIVFGDAEIVYYEGEGPSDRLISKSTRIQ